jgi:hypothetical protein
MPTPGDEGQNLRFPIYALCVRHADQLDQEFLAPGEVDGRKCVVFYHNKELAELAVEQAAIQSGQKHHLLTIDDKNYLIEVLKAIPHEVRHIVWNKQLEAAGMFDMQVIDCLLGWQIRHG